MKQIGMLPPAFARYERMMGVLEFAVFEDADGTENEIISAIAQALQPVGPFDGEKLHALGCRRIDERAFFGHWYDFDTGMLVKRGRWRTDDGRELEDPSLKDLDRVTIISGGTVLPEGCAGGQFAYAFSSPPYGLKARPGEIQSVFNDVKSFLLPSGEQKEICDWSHPQLPEVSGYFSAGIEWWGVFLFSIYLPEIRRLSIVTGSATD